MSVIVYQTRIILNKICEAFHCPKRRMFGVIVAAAGLTLAGCASPPVVTAPVVTAPVLTPPVVVKKPPRLGLALGGGAARGFAHVGVIQVLEEAGIRPDLVVGTSAGSLVAAFYASGKSGAQLQKVAETMEEAAFTDWTLPLFSRGMLRGEALARYVTAQVGSRAIEDMPMPLGIVATDLNSAGGRAVPPRRHGHGGAGVERCAGGVPAGAHRAGATTWTAAWFRQCRCASPGRWVPSW